MTKKQPEVVYLKDYQPSDFLIDHIDIAFELDPDKTIVTSLLSIKPREGSKNRELVLDGDALTLLSVKLNDNPLTQKDYTESDTSLTLHEVPLTPFRVEVQTEISPKNNAQLMGLYLTNGVYCTQCEAEGFRRITYYLDRPDILARFSTTIISTKKHTPVMLSNGNPIKEGTLKDGRTYVTWQDPFPKPCYLFALVAGDLACLKDSFTTMSGREVSIHIYSEKQNIQRCDHAMGSVKKAMKWDEEKYGREYDLDLFMLVAVNDFNFGAMENKGLNIFNSKYILAAPDTATDDDFSGVDIVVAHEYFHNWSGDRVTLRDWFQLSLKEGFTVYREQSFSEDLISKTTQRIDTVNQLRHAQFTEDAGPLAHPVRPDAYMKIDNFYTSTIYNKGSELIRMMHTLLGDKAYREATDHYFMRFDGQAVTTNDFVDSMQSATEMDLTQFRLWYTQAGTPEVSVKDHYDEASQTYSMTFTQTIPDTPGQTNKSPMVIPIRLGLLAPTGKEVALSLNGQSPHLLHGDVLVLDEKETTFTFNHMASPVVPSLLRHFSAPVKLTYDYSDEQLSFLMQHDSDGFNRWEAGQRFMLRVLLGLVDDVKHERALSLPSRFLEAYEQVLTADIEDKILHAQLLMLPTENYIAEQMAVADVDAIHVAREFMLETLAKTYQAEWHKLYETYQSKEPYAYTLSQVGARSIKNTALRFLLALDDVGVHQLAMEQFKGSLKSNMTDTLAALSGLAHTDSLERVEALSLFYDAWENEALVMNKWLTVQAVSKLPNTLGTVRRLMKQPIFNVKNPNNVYALIGGFCNNNPVQFHAKDGIGYRFAADQVIDIDRLNPMVAARILQPLTQWRRYDSMRQTLMREQLERLHKESLSKNSMELVGKSL